MTATQEFCFGRGGQTPLKFSQTASELLLLCFWLVNRTEHFRKCRLLSLFASTGTQARKSSFVSAPKAWSSDCKQWGHICTGGAHILEWDLPTRSISWGRYPSLSVNLTHHLDIRLQLQKILALSKNYFPSRCTSSFFLEKPTWKHK